MQILFAGSGSASSYLHSKMRMMAQYFQQQTLFSANLLLSKMEPLYFVLHIYTLGVVAAASTMVPFFKRESIKIKLAWLSIYIPLFLKKIFLDWRPDQIKLREECTLIRQKW